MDRNAITTAIFLFLLVADVSNASLFWKLRYLADESPTKNNTTAATPPSSPSPSPLSGAKKSDPKPDSTSKLDPNLSNKTDSVTPPPDDKKNPKPLDKPEKVSPPPQKEIDSGNNSSSTSNSQNDKTMEDSEKKKNIDSGKNRNSTETGKGVETKEDKKQKQKQKTNGDESDSKSGIVETCDGIANSCTDGNSLSACIKDFETGSKKLVVLVQNRGERTLIVNFAGASEEPKGLKVPKHGTERINISLTVSESSRLVLSAGNGDCVLPVDLLVSEGNFFLNLPYYDKLVTPVNGAYFLIVTVLIFGGSWACCMLRKRRRHDGIPYQELEMGLPESMAAIEVETAEGWDQGWDDEWDEDKAVKSPVGRHVANISANGLTARSSNRDGWENDWDD
ncbi:PREDICTED: uncharacterized protein LOC18602214 [Theobroma cacao]|uniref:Uncharacterized protein LOC18602214 n=1 Tax=Theobroma cacao TaxID=3641 RepID=A0AB32V9Y0_THECC|nr:PREDICTED: uncharacterized protein LOC18602214 [Theobroma cacao]